MKKLILLVFTFLWSVFIIGQESPWGVAGHLRRTPHKERRVNLLKLSKEANIKWLRDGFQFANVCADKNKMDFEAYDLLFADTDQADMQVLAILQAFDSEIVKKRPELKPIHKHPEEWKKFVRATVERYHSRIKNWEVWNEQDGGFWEDTPTRVEDYVKILKIAHAEIKAIDPDANVFIGGLSGWNGNFVESLYLAGAKGYFDAIAVHPYHYGVDVNVSTEKKMNHFYDVLEKYGQSNLPVWITESGGSSYTTPLIEKTPTFLNKAIDYSLSKLNVDPKKAKIGVAVSPRVDPNDVETFRTWLPGVQLELVTYDQLLNLDPKEIPALIGAEGGAIDEPLLDPLREYVKKGGLFIAVSTGGASPALFNIHYQDANGVWKTKQEYAKTMQSFRMKYEASWTIPGGVIPASTTNVKTAPDALAYGVPSVSNVYTERFVNGKNMLPGDTYYPVVEAYNSKGGRLPADGIGLFTYDDWKGAVLYSSIRVQSGYTREEQANLLQRMYLSYIAAGVEKIFWYDLHDDGNLKEQPEHNFGLVDWQANPKPSYHAYKEMTQALGATPEFEERLSLGSPDIWGLVFRKKETDKKILAIWAVGDQSSVSIGKATINFEGTKVQFIELDEDGEVVTPRDPSSNEIKIKFGWQFHEGQN